MHEKTQSGEVASPRDLLTQAAAREFYLSSTDATRAPRREYDRLAFIAIVFLLAETHHDDPTSSQDIKAAAQYASDQYSQAIGEPLPIHANRREWWRMGEIATSVFQLTRPFEPADNLELAQAILDKDQSKVRFVPTITPPDHHLGDAA